MSSEDWTPYGLEAIRIQYLRRRQTLIWLLLLLLLLLVVIFLGTATETSQSISVNGKDANGNSIQIDDKSGDGPKGGEHVTVGLEPGKVTRAEQGGSAGSPSITSNAPPVAQRAPAYNWTAFLILYGPYVLLGLAAWFLAKRRSRHHEVNFGIYKGAMPFEMITATHERHVFTKKLAETSLFGKGMYDHLPRQIADVEAATIEDEEAAS